MVHANTILESLITTCKADDVLPDDLTYATVELDETGQHSNVSPPVVEFSIDGIDRDRARNDETWGVATDDTGTEIGYIYTQWFDLEVTVTVLTVAGSSHNHRELDQALRQALYRYDIHGPSEQLPDPDDPTTRLPDVNWLAIDETNPSHDFGRSPSVRTRQVGLDIGFTHEITTMDLGIEYDVVENVRTPTDAVASADDDDVINLVLDQS